MSKSYMRLFRLAWLAFLAVFYSTSLLALEIAKDERWQLNLDLDAGYGMFHSDESYAGTPDKEAGSSNWT